MSVPYIPKDFRGLVTVKATVKNPVTKKKYSIKKEFLVLEGGFREQLFDWLYSNNFRPQDILSIQIVKCEQF